MSLPAAAFAVAVVVGGSNYVAVRYSNRELDPLWGAFLRFALAAAVFAALVALLRLPLPRGRRLGPSADRRCHAAKSAYRRAGSASGEGRPARKAS